ncbi:MAG: laccase domain-containing protein [Microbacteriaceae bacterium]|nr:laccase domain-containing protein [Microbacteriaceae bacterium]
MKFSKVSDGSMLNRGNFSDSEVRANRERFLASNVLDIDQTALVTIMYNDEVSYTHYEEVNPQQLGKTIRGDLEVPQVADALITTDPKVTIFLALADCVGTVLYSPREQVLMVSHLGRHSLEQNGGFLSVQKLVSDYGVDSAELQVWLSPAPSKESYQIWKLGGAGMKETVFAQLQDAGVKLENIVDNPAETDKSEEYFSHSQFKAGNREADGRFAVIANMGAGK